MSRVLKYDRIKIDEDNRIRIEYSEYAEKKAATNALEKSFEDPKEKPMEPHSLSAIQIIEQAKKGADLILRRAQDRASALIDEAKELSESFAEEIEEESKKQGYEEGYSKGEAEAEAIKAEAQTVKEDALKEKEILFESAEEEMVNLISNIVKKLLDDTVEINPKVILALIKKGIRGNGSSEDVIIRVSEEDYAEVVANKEEILKLVEASSKTEIIKDISLNKSDCIIETPFGNIDCSLKQQYDTLNENLYHIYHESGDLIEND